MAYKRGCGLADSVQKMYIGIANDQIINSGTGMTKQDVMSAYLRWSGYHTYKRLVDRNPACKVMDGIRQNYDLEFMSNIDEDIYIIRFRNINNSKCLNMNTKYGKIPVLYRSSLNVPLRNNYWWVYNKWDEIFKKSFVAQHK